MKYTNSAKKAMIIRMAIISYGPKCSNAMAVQTNPVPQIIATSNKPIFPIICFTFLFPTFYNQIFHLTSSLCLLLESIGRSFEDT